MEKVTIQCAGGSYDIVVECGGLPRLGDFAAACLGGGRKVAVATTETVASLYLKTALDSLKEAGFEVFDVVVPDGEEYKTLETYEGIVTRLIEAHFERSSAVIPLGGGVIGDMAGFVAATLLRGIPFLQVPTTIVAQVDSSIGGKVAVDHPLGKNLIGSFYQPRGVWIDPRVLVTLERREVVSGMAECVKHAMIRDGAFLSFIEENLEDIMTFRASDGTMERFIAWNCRIKAGIVSADERESGLRAILNYGHTVGHALETVTGYRRFKHGEAVILGMIAAARIAELKGLLSPVDRDRQNRLLGRVGITDDLGGISVESLYEAMRRDKKIARGVVRFVLPDAIGSAAIYDDLADDMVTEGIRYMFRCAGAGG